MRRSGICGGIGENAIFIRERILAGLEPLGIELDQALNDHRSRDPFRISPAACPTPAWVIPTNEELMIARDTAKLIGAEDEWTMAAKREMAMV